MTIIKIFKILINREAGTKQVKMRMNQLSRLTTTRLTQGQGSTKRLIKISKLILAPRLKLMILLRDYRDL